ncbi:hypothetical protein NST21_24995 [Peribacillus sp. FSL K6-1552]|uniref:hypothetical protein n=1 Tax=Peribacillus sp. FSL K6-1552 TaxID=2954514 RepID=UPI0030F4F60B
MKVGKPFLIVLNLVFSAIIIYCTALVGKLFKGRFLFENGLFDPKYIFLALAIAIPVILYTLIANGRYKKNIFEVISFSNILILVLCAPVYVTLVFEGSLKDPMKFVITFLVTSVVLVGTSHFAVNYHKYQKGNNFRRFN